MENKVKRIGYLPRKRVLEIIDEISKSESISRSKVVGILVEEALDARGIANFGYSNISKSKSYKSDIYKIPGCASLAWVYVKKNNDKYKIHTNSDAFIVKGLLSILEYIINDSTKNEIFNLSIINIL